MKLVNTERQSPNRRRLLGAMLAGGGALALGSCASSGKPPDLPRLPSLGNNVNKSQWRTNLGPAGIGFALAIQQGELRVADRDGQLSTIDLATGKVVGREQTNAELAAGVGSNDEVSVVADTEGQLIAIDRQGKQRWSINMGAQAVSVPALNETLAIVRQSNNAIVAYSLADGSRRWLYTRRNPTLVLRQTSGIVLDEQAAYAGLPGGRMVSLLLDTGASRWDAGISVPRGSNEIERIADVVATPVLSGDSLCAAAYQGRVTCLDKLSGRSLWSKKLSAGSGVDLDADSIFSVDVDGKLMAHSRNGELRWEQSALRGRRLSAPRLGHGYLWVGDANGFVHSIDPASGDLTGRTSTDGSQIVSPPLVIDAADQALIVVQTTAGAVVALSV